MDELENTNDIAEGASDYSESSTRHDFSAYDDEPVSMAESSTEEPANTGEGDAPTTNNPDSSVDSTANTPAHNGADVDPRITDYEIYKDFIDELKAIGSPEAIRQQLAEQHRQSLARQEQTIEQNRRNEIQAWIEAGDITPEVGAKLLEQLGPLFRLEAHLPQIEQQRQAQEQAETERIVEQATQAILKDSPHADPLAIRLAIQNQMPPEQIVAMARESHARVQKAIDATRTQTTVQTAQRRAAIPAVDNGSGTPATGGNDIDVLANPEAWAKQREAILRSIR